MTADPDKRQVDPLPAGWVMVSAPPLRQRLSVIGMEYYLGIIIVANFMPLVAELVYGERTLWGSLLAYVAFLLLCLAGLLLQTLWRSKVWVNFDTSHLRVGRKISELADIDSAVLAVLSSRRVPSLSLQLRTGSHVRAVIPLRHRSDVLLTDDGQRRLLAELMHRTRIELPEDPHDPQRKFVRYNFPGHIDRDTAIDLVLNPPEAYEPLPVSF